MTNKELQYLCCKNQDDITNQEACKLVYAYCKHTESKMSATTLYLRYSMNSIILRNMIKPAQDYFKEKFNLTNNGTEI